MIKVVFLEPLGVAMEKFTADAKTVIGDRAELVFYPDRVTDVPTLIERSKDADIVVLSNFKYPREVIEACPKLKMICVAFTGVDHIDAACCKERGIMICNCAGYSTSAVADLVFGMLITLARNIIPCNEVVRKGGTKDGLVGFELEGKAFGIVGTGAIGLRVASIAQAFGCNVYAYSRTRKDIPGITYVSLDELMATCDIVSLHVPSTPATKGLINADNLALMKPGAILINTARGPVVDSEALAAALTEGRLAGACIDVFEDEPPLDPSHPLLHAPNVIATPHVAFATKQAFEKRAVIVYENIRCYLDGHPQNVVQ